ncbi:TonB-dependent receptor [Haloflavibacter putidus]|uniref:TonB-dependent receptor n=1 Tax=Haloflavibacter putidus TaxID=2576776 RepID=A0A507ZHP1_9FLAO|nr:TonB-dependent receptor [Haloflavibacter putidus]TQD35388.1 TonB-dependent receptor [Haloflavibacter putidus]
MKRLLTSVLVFILVAVFPLYGQNKTGSISGKVTDYNDNLLPFISIQLEGTKKGVSTNFDGEFKLENLAPKSYTLLVSGLGFSSVKQKLSLKAGEELKVNFRLQESIAEIEEVLLLGQNKVGKLRQSAKAVSVIETKEVKLQTADLGEILTRTSGVNVRRSGGLGSNTRFSLNGLTDDQIRFMVDGIPLDFMGYSSGIANVPVNLVDQVEVYKGVVPVSLGADALGGVVNLVSQKDSIQNTGAISYQTGAFGTHRLAVNGETKLNENGLFFRGSSFYDYAKNNYEVDVEIAGEGGKLKEVRVPRFHDAYKGAGLRGTFGVRNRSWVNELSVEVFANIYQKDIQNNNIMSIVYGEVTSEEDNYGALLRYRKNLSEKLKLKTAAGYTQRKITFIDTSKYIYNWYGEKVRNNNGDIIKSTPGEVGNATNLLTKDDNLYGRFNLNYQLAPQHNLHFSSAPTYISRTIKERWLAEGQSQKTPDKEQSIFSWVNGLEYIWQSSNKKIENILFAKDYLYSVEATEKTSGLPINRDQNTHNFGFGNSFRFKINSQWLLKASYEWATRLPRPTQIFGNGRLVVPNLALKPERSHNANLEINYGNNPTASSNWNIKFNAFLRSTDQLILLLGNNEVFSYQNVFAARSLGAEVSAFWETANNKLRLEANATWQDFTNQSSEGEFGRYNGDRIPNRPYLFGNTKVNYRFFKLFDAKDKLTAFWTTHYVYEFYRGWESVGLIQFKDQIPAQFVHNLGVTYELPIKSVKTALTAEIQNLADTDVYDFFGVQRPGRAFYIKLTTQF